jgi:RHS repeat-associated protein
MRNTIRNLVPPQITRLSRLLFVSCGIALSGAVQAADLIGAALPGDLQVHQGNASYRIPIEVYPGTNGLQPNLTLQYNSSSPNSLLGQGWAIGGLSSISRCPRDQAREGISGGVNFDNNDRFCIDGQRMVAVSGDYGADGTEYRTENNDYRKIIYRDLLQGFEVKTPDGFRYHYGYDLLDAGAQAAFKREGSSDIQIWGLSEVWGGEYNHRMVFKYHNSGQQFYLNQIRYGGSYGNQREVNFRYEARDDVAKVYHGGVVSLNQTKRLKTVEVKNLAGATDSYTYDLSYQYSAQTNNSLLTSVQRCADTTCVPATSFSWSNNTTPLSAFDFDRQQPGSEVSGDEYQDQLRFDEGANIITGDFNGDGKGDFIRQEKGAWDDDIFNNFSIYFGGGRTGEFNIVQPSGDAYQSHLRFDHGATIVPGDFNGDGKTDFIRQEKGRWDNDASMTFSLYLANDNTDVDGTFDILYPSGNAYQYDLKSDNGAKIIPGDFNGDGRTDFIRQEHGSWDDDSNNTFKIYFATANTAVDGTFDIKTPVGSDYQDHLKSDGTDNGGVIIIPGDFNGDGRTDFMHQQKGSWDDDAISTFRVYLATDNTSVDGTFNILEPQGDAYQVDLRHDGINDDNGVLLITGDFNGDGKTDFIRQEKGTWDDDNINNFMVYYSKGDGHFDIHTPGDAVQNDQYQHLLRYDSFADDGASMLTTGDFNGDGKTDFLRQPWGDWAFRGRQFYTPMIYFSTGINGEFEQVWLDFPEELAGFNWGSAGLGGPYQDLETFHGGAILIPGDFDGDGTIDLIRQDAHYADDNYVNNFAVYYNKLSYQAITAINNGTVTTNISYDNLADMAGSSYTDADGQYPSAKSVVNSVTRPNGKPGAGQTTTTNYQYSDFEIDRLGKGGASFSTIDEITTYADGTVVSEFTDYDLAHPLNWQLAEKRIRMVDGDKLTETRFVNQTTQIGGVYQSWVGKTKTYQYPVSGGSYYTATEDIVHSIDAFGNPLHTETIVWGNGAWHHVNTTRTYSNDTGHPAYWHVKRLLTESVTYTGFYGAPMTTSSEYTYNLHGLLTTAQETTTRGAGDPGHLRISYGYDVYGNNTSTTTTDLSGSQGNRIETQVYDSNGIYMVQSCNTLNHCESTSYNDQGYPASSTDINGLVTNYSYDAIGRLLSTTVPDGTVTTNTFFSHVQEYWSGTTIHFRVETATSGISGHKRSYFDKLGRNTGTRVFGFDSTVLYTELVYDALGRQYKRSLPYFSYGSTPRWIETTFDVKGREVSRTAPAGEGTGTVSISYDDAAYTVVKTDVLNTTVSTAVKDAMGNDLTVTDANGTVTSHSYNNRGQLTQTVTPSGKSILFGYDVHGNRNSMDDPSLGLTTYQHNAFAEMIGMTNALGQVTTYEFDTIGRMTRRTDDVQGATPMVNSWWYDYQHAGKLYKESRNYQDEYARWTFYDSLMRVSAQTHRTDGVSQSISYQYDGNSRNSKVTYPGGFAVNYQYNSYGYLLAVKNTDQTLSYWTASDYDEFTRPASFNYGNGVSSNLSYNSGGQLTGITAFKGASTLSDLQYEYDLNDNITQRTNSNGDVQNFSYDNLDRLISTVVSGGQYNYSYNAFGNITQYQKTGGSAHPYTYDANNPYAVLSARGHTYQYDAMGQVTNKDGRAIEWTTLGKPSRFSTANGTVDFEYGPDTRRFKKVATNLLVTAKTWYLGKDYEEFSLNDTLMARKYYIYAAGKLIATQLTDVSNSSSVLNYQHYDNLDSVVMTTDTAGVVVSKGVFSVFGQAVSSSDYDTPVNTSTQGNRGFTGHEHIEDDGLSLIHMNGRVFDPQIGRFLSADPYIQAPDNSQSFNRYSYVMNNPLKYTDPTGYSFFSSVGNWFKGAAKTVYNKVLKPAWEGTKKFFNSKVAQNILVSVGFFVVGTVLNTAAFAVGTFACAGVVLCGAALAMVVDIGVSTAEGASLAAVNGTSVNKGARTGAINGAMFAGTNLLAPIGKGVKSVKWVKRMSQAAERAGDAGGSASRLVRSASRGSLSSMDSMSSISSVTSSYRRLPSLSRMASVVDNSSSTWQRVKGLGTRLSGLNPIARMTNGIDDYVASKFITKARYYDMGVDGARAMKKYQGNIDFYRKHAGVIDKVLMAFDGLGYAQKGGKSVCNNNVVRCN